MRIKRLTKLIASVLLSVSILCGATPVYEVTVPDNNDVAVVASYEKIYRTVRYYVTNTQYKDVSVEWGTNALDSKYINQVNPAFSGYTFYGWTESPTAVSGANTPSKINAKAITQNATLYAIFSKEVSVAFDKGNAQSASLPGTQRQTGFYSNGRFSTLTFSFPQTLSYTYAGYGFRGWSTSSGASSGVYSYTTANNSSATYYAAFAFTPSISASPSTMSLSTSAGHGSNGWYSATDQQGYVDIDVRGVTNITVTASICMSASTQDEGDGHAYFIVGTAGTNYSAHINRWEDSTYDCGRGREDGRTDADGSASKSWGSGTVTSLVKTGRSAKYYLWAHCSHGNSNTAYSSIVLTIPVNQLQSSDYISNGVVRIYYRIQQLENPYGGGECYKNGTGSMSVSVAVS